MCAHVNKLLSIPRLISFPVTAEGELISLISYLQLRWTPPLWLQISCTKLSSLSLLGLHSQTSTAAYSLMCFIHYLQMADLNPIQVKAIIKLSHLPSFFGQKKDTHHCNTFKSNICSKLNNTQKRTCYILMLTQHGSISANDSEMLLKSTDAAWLG